MRLCSYVIVHDTGFAPNPFGGYFPHVHLAAARHHLLPLCDFDLCAPLHARLWAERLGVVLGDSGRAVRHRPVGGQLYPAEPDLRDGTGRVNAGTPLTAASLYGLQLFRVRLPTRS
jgi:hypothetical protein